MQHVRALSRLRTESRFTAPRQRCATLSSSATRLRSTQQIIQKGGRDIVSRSAGKGLVFNYVPTCYCATRHKTKQLRTQTQIKAAFTQTLVNQPHPRMTERFFLSLAQGVHGGNRPSATTCAMVRSETRLYRMRQERKKKEEKKEKMRRKKGNHLYSGRGGSKNDELFKVKHNKRAHPENYARYISCALSVSGMGSAERCSPSDAPSSSG